MIHGDEEGIIGARVARDQTEGLGLFDAVREPSKAPARAPRRAMKPRSWTKSAAEPDDRQEAIAKLKGLVLDELLRRAAARCDRPTEPGVTADDVIAIATTHPCHALLGSDQRAWSWVGPWLGALSKQGLLSEFIIAGHAVRRPSRRPGAHGNLQIVHLDPRDHRAGQKAA